MGMATEASTPRRKLSAILMVDVSGFSRMMGRDEEGTTALIREFHTRTQSLVEAHEGWVVDTAGDSVFGEFDSVVNAVRCAQAIQQTQATVNAPRPPSERIETRIGVHLGDVIVQDYHVYGDGVNIAARLQAVAAPGSICVSEAVYQQVYKKLDLAFEDLGVQELKNIEHPLRLYRVVGPRSDQLAAPPQAPQHAVQMPSTWQPAPPTTTWTAALLQPESLIPLVVGAYLLATHLWLSPTRGVFPAVGAVLVGVGLGRAWARRTGQHGYFLIALGVGIMLGAVGTPWRSGTRGWVLLGGVVTVARGVSKLRTASVKKITVSGSDTTSTVNQSEIYDLIVSGSRNVITTAPGNKITTIKISGSNNTLTVGRDNAVAHIVTSGSNNTIFVPSGSGITITANTGSHNQVQLYHPD